MVSHECKVSKHQRRLFNLNSHLPKSGCHLKPLWFHSPVETACLQVYLFWALPASPDFSLLNTLPNECEKQMPAVYSSVYFRLTALINAFHRWCSPVIKGGQIQTALLEPSQHTDWISNCCQRLTEIQLTFFICEFASSQTWSNTAPQRNHIWEIAFEIRLHVFMKCYEADRERISHICVILISLSAFHLLQLFHFLNFHISLPFISAVMLLSSHVLTVCSSEHALLGTRCARCCAWVWLLTLSLACAAYQTAQGTVHLLAEPVSGVGGWTG